ncbi:reverse transcriptase domain-containing protein [Tanacetum coccineum]
MMIATTAFIRGEAAAAIKKKGHASWRTHDQSKRHASDQRSDFRGQPREGRGSSRFTPLTRTPKEILAAEAGKFKPPPPMVTPMEKRSSNKFCDFHNDKGHSTDECIQLKKHIGELVRAGKLSHLIKEIKQGRDQPKVGKKEVPAKDKSMAIYMIQPWHRMIRQKVTQSFKRVSKIMFPSLTTSSGTKGPLVIEAEIDGHMIHSIKNRARPLSGESQPNRGTKLVEAGIMREVYYHEWLSNPVMVKKHDGSWRMCVDFTDLNKAYPQDCYPLLEIDWKVESLCGYPFKYFLDAYKGYHKIQMAESDEEKTAFHTSHGVYCYTKMPFGLKNAGATYQRLVDKDFDSQVGRNIEVYVDDLVIKSHTEAEMLRDINETFRTLSKINMKLNPKKCTFGAVEGMFLGYMISPEGIKLCPNKTEVVLQLPSPRTIKEILADFLVEKLDESPPYTSVVETPQEPWTLFTDGSSSSNNEAEYEALIAGLRIAAQMGVRNVHVSVDSKLVANQVLEAYVAKEENMIKYMEKVKSLVSGFANFSISQVPRSKSKKADALSKIASTSFAHLSKQVLVEILKEKSIQEKEVTTVVEEDGLTWMTPIIEYLKEGTLPEDKKEASNLRIKARQYELWEGVLYRQSFLKPWLRCVGPLHADYVIREIHEGSCSMGIDIAGPFPEGPGKVKFLIVAMDYFTKWIEAKAVSTITTLAISQKVKKFVWDNIVCRFGLPGEIVSDNGKHFSDNPFKDWCEKFNITQRFASVKHPQSNGLVERVNRSLGDGIKARLGEGNKNWIEELLHILWAHRTTIKSSHGDTPFSLTYGTEAVIPAEIEM